MEHLYSLEKEIQMIKTKADFLTLIALSTFSFILATAIHEHGGHALACAVLGGHIKELGAFYVNCEYASLSATGNRLVALAGPLISMVTGIIGLSVFERVQKTNPILKYFLWLFGTVNLMTAFGYLLFSGVAGIGDLGTDQFGFFYQVQPEWAYRVGLSILGFVTYLLVIKQSLRKMDRIIGGEGIERVKYAQTLSMTSYLAGGVAAILIGFLNPYGIIIVLISSVASSMGGTSGLAWMMHMLDRTKISTDAPLEIRRSWAWILTSAAFVIIYAVVFGPTLYFK